MNDDDMKEEIESIIHSFVGIREGNYGWGGQQYELTRTEVAADKILKAIKKNLSDRDDKFFEKYEVVPRIFV